MKPITILLFIFVALNLRAQEREFTSSTGQKITASVVSISGPNVMIKRSGAQTVSVPISRFSDADKAYLKQWQEENKGKVPEHLKDKLPRLNMVVTNAARASKDGDKESGFVNEQNKKFQLKAALTNEDGVYPIPSASLIFLVWGESTETGKDTVVYRKEFKDFEMPLNVTKNFETERFEVWWDDIGAKYGHEYKGYFALVIDPDQKVLGYKTMPGTAGKYVDSIKELKAGDTFDRSYRPIGKEDIKKTIRKTRN